MKLIKIFFTGLLATLLLCSATPDKYAKRLYTPTTSDATANASLKELEQGRMIYINRCKQCHGLANPDKYTRNDWQIIVGKMSLRAKLTVNESTLLFKYATRGK
ncbi:MAG: hypothetical protein PHV20_13245 [Bacteroidales bacterium]|nr:hypothetical protein [Bacteroidales bacterium]